jgi:phthiocerol/phenolphthiocerol synthesis type-I polyketide synthase C
MTRRVAIVGQSFRFPATGPDSWWDDLLAGRNLITQIDQKRFATEAFRHPDQKHPGTSYTFAAGVIDHVGEFDSSFFGISPREAALVDPQQRLLLELGWEALESAGIAPSTLHGTAGGVFVGISSNDYAYRMVEDLAAVDSPGATGNAASIAANRLSWFFDLHGPSMAIDTACSSSLVAFHQACRAVESGEVPVALAGGVNLLLHPYVFVSFSKAGMLSRQGRCRVFDASADGYVRAEGGGLVVLKDLEQALADGNPVLAVVAGSGTNTDGHTQGLTVPSARAQAALMAKVYQTAGESPEALDYLEAHGTGTPVGDPVETRAISQALARHRSRPLPIGSVKSNMGHLEAASGIAGLIKGLLCLKHRVVPATIGIQNLNPNIPIHDWNLDIVQQNRPLRAEGPLLVGVNSFGFGGANAHVVLRSFEPSKPSRVALPAQRLPVVVTATDAAGLRENALRLAAHLENKPVSDWPNVAHTLNFRRDWLPARLLVEGSAQEVAATLRAHAENSAAETRLAVAQALPAPVRLAFVYSGNGSQWEGMARRLLTDSAVFRASVQEVDALFRPIAGFSLLDELLGLPGPGRYAATEFAQPALFAMQVGLTRLLELQGVKPNAVTGHSVGEIAAAWAAGALSLGDAVHVVHHRSRLQGMTRGTGGMTAVKLSAAQLEHLLDDLDLRNQLVIAARNSADSCTIAGPIAELERCEVRLQAAGHVWRRLDLDYAFHSPAMDPIEDALRESLVSLRPGATRVPLHSTVTGTVLAGEQLDAGYWWRNIREPVAFGPAIEGLLASGVHVCIEIGPHPVLTGYLRRASQDQGLQTRLLHTQSRKDDSPRTVWQAGAQAVLAGAVPDWSAAFPHPLPAAQLPRYAWQRRACWHGRTPSAMGLLDRTKTHLWLGYPQGTDASTWECPMDTALLPTLADHRVQDAIVFPAAGYAELCLAAVAGWQSGHTLTLSDLDIRAPLLLAQETTTRVRTRLDTREGKITIEGQRQSEVGDALLHAKAWAPAESVQLPACGPLVLPRRAADFDAAAHYQQAHARALDYGPAFQRVQQGWREGRRIIAVLREAGPEEAAFHLAPTLLDAAFQLILQWSEASGEHAFVPVRIGRLVCQRRATAPVAAEVEILSATARTLSARCVLYGRDGEPLAILDAVELRRIPSLADRRPAQRLTWELQPLLPAHGPSTAPTNLFERVRTGAEELFRHLVRDGEGLRYINEFEPLLDCLCRFYTRHALAGLMDDQGWLDPAHHSASQTRLWLAKVLAAAEAEGTLVQESGRWQMVPAGESDRDALAAIQGSLLAEHPDQAELILAVTRTGERLPALLSGELDWARLHPRDLALATLLDRARGTTTGARLGRGIAQLLAADSLAQTAARVLEVTAGDPLLLSHTNSLHLASPSHHMLASATPKVLMGARARWPFVPTEDLHADPAQAVAVDCVLVMEDANSLDESLALLRHAKSRLRAEGVLMLMGHFPARWLDFVMGARTAWFGNETGWLDRQQPPAFWRRQLDALGFDDITLLALDPDLAAGPWLLVAKFPKAKVSVDLLQPPAETPLNTGIWQLLTSEVNPLVAAVERELCTQGHTVRVYVGDGCPALNGVDAVIDFPVEVLSSSLHPANGAPSAMRCARVAALVRALECDNPPTQCWLVTRNAWGIKGMAVDDAALWGFARTVANETERADFHLVDLADFPTPERAAQHLLVALANPGAERERIFKANGDTLVPRLRPAPTLDKPDALAGDTRTSLVVGQPGSLDQLHWATDTLPPLEDDEIEVHVEASALNFRDLMLALGLLPPESVAQGFAGPTLGLEFSGTVTRVGRRELVYRQGDRVLGYGAACFSNRVRTRRWALAPVPLAISFEAAATIPTAFVTAWYALHHVARLRSGERVLIHGAAGGVGLAALQVARLLGAEVYATVGSEEKRDFLRLLGVNRLYDSRSLTFADGILADTAGEGVDVVLNSLSGDALGRSLDVLRAFGRFIELGKRDFHENTRLGLRPFRNNVSYHGVDVDQLMRLQPDLARTLLDEVIQRFRSGDFQPLPYRTFNAEQVVEAFRHMQSARHIGKIVLNYPHGVPAGVNAIAPSPMTLEARGAYLITGGLSGFGLRAAGWLVARGARHVVLLGRSGQAREDDLGLLASWRSQGCRVDTIACDITDLSALKRALDEIAASGARLRGVLHAAAVYDDGVARNLDASRIANVLAPKICGAQNLVSLTREMSMDFIVFFSSATTLFGNPGQAAYVAANHWLESFARAGRIAGLPITCMSFGPIADTGYLARNASVRASLADRLGGRGLTADEALSLLERALTSNTPVVTALDFSWSVLSRGLNSAAKARFSEITIPEQTRQPGTTDAADFREHVEGLDGQALRHAVLDQLRESLGAVLGLSADEVDVQAPIHALGLDSLMAVELSVSIERGFGVRVPEMGLGDRTLVWLSERVIRLMFPETADPENEVDEQRAAQIQFLARHAESAAADLFPHAHHERSA